MKPCLMPATLLAAATLAARGGSPAAAQIDGLATIRKGCPQGFANAGWKYDRYKDLPSLDAHQRMPVADLEGPGIIRHIHTTRHAPAELFARGIVLEIWFDDAQEPAVLCPLADFFGDGCNGASMNFTTPLIECAPWSYNSYFPMPFAKRARVFLRNDTARDTGNYSYVEWERLPAWDPSQGYFHATYARKRFQLTTASCETFLALAGSGHLVGRQFSVITDEPAFRDFNDVMEGNNEIDVDGRERALDYLGTEDSFTFSWGFREPFAGLRAGMPYVRLGARNELSIYRFHDHMPIRFDAALTWRINWQFESGLLARAAALRTTAEQGGGWVDYATVHYWYQDSPGGYQHEPLPEPALRGNVLPATDRELAGLLSAMPADPEPRIGFATAADLQRVRVVNAWPKTHPFWIDVPQPTGGHPGNPNPGRTGILGVHAASAVLPAYVLAKVTPPAAGKKHVRLVVSGDPYEAPNQSDFVVGVGVAEAGRIRWLGEQVIAAGTPPDPGNWRTVDYELPAAIAGPVGIVIKVAYGGAVAGMNEEAFLDEIGIMED